MSTDLAISPDPAVLPAKLFAPTKKAAKRVLEFFTAQCRIDTQPADSDRSRPRIPTGKPATDFD